MFLRLLLEKLWKNFPSDKAGGGEIPVKLLKNSENVRTILMDLSKAHDLLIAKLQTYGLDVGSLNFLLDYLSLRKHRTKVGSSYSKWSEICQGIPQGSILGPLY